MMSGAMAGGRATAPAGAIIRSGWLATAVAVLLAGCISSEPAPTDPLEGDVVVDMTAALTFAPATVQVQSGGTVVWTNGSSMPHTVTADPDLAANPASVTLPAGAEPFASPLIGAGGSYSRTFTVPGTYRYFCQPHEGAGMIGVVEVLP